MVKDYISNNIIKKGYLISQIRKFIISGGGATLSHLATMWLLIYFGVYATIATAIGMIIGAILNYFFQYNWTFQANIGHLKSVKNYLITVALSFLSNLLLFWLFYEVFLFNAFISQTATSVIVALQNYIIYKKFVFLREGAVYEA